MIRRSLLGLSSFLFLFWLLWPRAWLPSFVSVPPSLLIASADAELLADDGDASPDAAAILLLASDQEAFAAARVLRSAGVPFVVTRGVAEALAHRLVIVPAGERAMRLPQEDRLALGAFAANGGTLVVQAAGQAPWPELTGLESAAPSRRRRRLAFRADSDDGFRLLTRPELREVRLASDAVSEGIWTAALTPRRGAADVIASYPDTREGAMTRRRIGRGLVYALGVDLRDVFVRPQAGRDFDARRSPNSAFEPGADVWPLIFLAWYESQTPDWVRLRSLPGDASGLLLLSHSLESGDSPAAARAFSAWESSRGVTSTWFIQANETDSGQPGPFFDAGLASAVRELASNGHELAAHTAIHTENFAALPFGTGLEKRRTYRPQTVNGALWDATVMGEIRVPKQALEQEVPDALIAGFRSPRFQFPEILDEALASTGYSWDSSLSAPASLTHRPFLLTRRRTMTAESRVVELPSTFSDELPSRLPPLEAADVLRAVDEISSEEGVVVWQSRPSERARALEAEVLDRLPPGVAVGPLGKSARWWGAREKTRFRLEPGRSSASRVLRLRLPPEADGAELSFEFARAVRSCAASPGVVARCAGRRAVIVKTSGARDVSLRLEFEQLDAPEARRVP